VDIFSVGHEVIKAFVSGFDVFTGISFDQNNDLQSYLE